MSYRAREEYFVKYAIVTGSTKGIGKAIAEKLLEEGWFVFVNYAHDREGAEQFIAEHRSDGCAEQEAKFEVIQAELSSYEGVQAFIERVLKRTARINCLVLNAGMTDRSPFDEILPETWERMIDTNINAPFYLVHGLRNHLSDGDGRIIFIGSLCGIYPHSVSPAYGITKAAVHQMARELVKFFAPRRITVNAIVPGFVNTQWQKTKSQERRARIEDKTALHRFGEPEEIASLCWEIINNQFINGANIQIDGGYCYQ